MLTLDHYAGALRHLTVAGCSSFLQRLSPLSFLAVADRLARSPAAAKVIGLADRSSKTLDSPAAVSQPTTGTIAKGCCQKKEINPVDFDELGLKHMSEEDRLEEIEYQRQHGHKPDKIVEPDTRLFEDFWHAGDASSNRVNTLPHSTLRGGGCQFVAIPSTPYYAAFVHDHQPRTVEKVALVDSRSAAVVHWLARCYLLFPDNGRLVTLRLTSLPSKDKSDPNKVDGEKQLYREVVIYDITKLPDLVVLEQYVIDEPISDAHAALESATTYSSACLTDDAPHRPRLRLRPPRLPRPRQERRQTRRRARACRPRQSFARHHTATRTSSTAAARSSSSTASTKR
jgi:hypothetical protein